MTPLQTDKHTNKQTIFFSYDPPYSRGNNFNSILFHILKRIKLEAIEGYILFSITTQFQILSIDYQNDIYIVKIAVSNSDLYLNKNQKIQLNYVINSNILVV